MRTKPPRVPPAVQLAYSGTRGIPVLPGDYKVRMTKGGEVYETTIPVVLDRRATYTVADRKLQYDAAMRVHRLFGEETALLERIQAVRGQLGERQKAATVTALQKQIADLEARVDAARKRIVATTEGGAITGEERLREHTDTLYGAILSYDGAPAAYQVERIGVLESELADVSKEFDALMTRDLPPLNAALQAAGLEAVEVPSAAATTADTGPGAGAGARQVRYKDEGRRARSLPRETVVYR
jgi:hypothetical protein